ncbi:hypothetical protein [Haloferax sp. YSSS75]|uniref:hypothetical protein n=1 Tax=Haloferax sp. YSSS75 TaxID=3388564 RepID=UPI00398D464D
MGRRQVLAGSGLVALVGLSGCLGQVASATTNTGSSPAATFAGTGTDRDSRVVPITEPTVERLSPKISADVSLLSGDVELEAWVTTVSSRAQNHNSSRSNRTQPVSADELDSDDDGDGIPTALELERRLLVEVEAAAESISKRSARTGRSNLERVDETITEVQVTLDSCSEDVCMTVRENADGRKELTRQALRHVDAGEWERAAETVREISRIVESDIERLQKASRGESGIPAAIYSGLDGEAVVGERFAVVLPDARLPGDSGSIADEVTPQRFIDYITGQANVNVEGRVYTWGAGSRTTDGGGDCDDTDTGIFPPGVCSSPHLDTALSGPVDTGGVLTVYDDGENVAVVNTPPTTRDGPSALAVSADGAAVVPENLDDWGDEQGESAATSTIVCQVMAKPNDFPTALPALLYVRRCRHDDQLVYTGGWVVDDAALYDDSLTMLTAGGPNRVVGVGLGDLDGDGLGDLVTRTFPDERSRYGGRLLDVQFSPDVENPLIPPLSADSLEKFYKWGRGHVASATERPEAAVRCVCVAMDAPILHLVDASSASNEVKFKAGAELSKSVN